MSELADKLYEAFWKATETIEQDPNVHPMDLFYADQEMAMVDTSGGGIPRAFWEHMARAFEEMQ